MPTQTPSNKTLIRKLGEYLSNLWSHLQYYRYDPSKPSKAAFLKLTLSEQEAWIEATVPNHEGNLYGENYLGCSYELDEDTLAEYLDCRDDYDVSGIISSQLPNLTEERLEAIDDGADLTFEEVEALKSGIAENDFHGWQIHSGQYIKVRFGAVYALYIGEDIGQGGAIFKLETVFKSKSIAKRALDDRPMIALE
jgi:hypothetical protein